MKNSIDNFLDQAEVEVAKLLNLDKSKVYASTDYTCAWGIKIKVPIVYGQHCAVARWLLDHATELDFYIQLEDHTGKNLQDYEVRPLAATHRRFELHRREDETGISGTGHIADGVEFEDGTCALRWRTEHRSTAIYPSFKDLLAIHGHDGKTKAVWIDSRVGPDVIIRQIMES